jgi:ATP-dependent RNA helicase RhlE
MPYTQQRSNRASYGGQRSSQGGNRRPSYGGGGGRKPMKSTIDSRRFVAAAVEKTPEAAYVATYKFADFPISDIIKDNLAKKGYETPSPIQDQSIMPALEGKDVLGMASTGTGKTAAFAIPLLHQLIEDPTKSALIIAPTRELAQQIEAECRTIGRGSGLMGALLIGGSPMRPQLQDLAAHPRIVIGTPGRIKDHLERGTLVLDGFGIVVLDEVDRMLDMGFVRDIRSILDMMADDRQSLFFSATMTKEVRSLIETFTSDPVTVKIQSSQASENVHQDVVRFDGGSDKFEKLKELLSGEEVSKVIIFDETQRGVERLYKSLYEHGFPVDSMHGGKSQGQRQRALRSFKNSDITMLVATDVAARGIDVSDITHVVNYSIPQVYDDYVHRIGRAGRAGKTGYAFTFVEHDRYSR